jgi:hypothetical protein
MKQRRMLKKVGLRGIKHKRMAEVISNKFQEWKMKKEM